MTGSKDSTAVRAGEELDLARLTDYLGRFKETGPLEIEQFPGGHSNLTYLVRWGEQEFVLRRPPVGPVAPSAHDMPREFNLLAAINRHFPLAPTPVLLCDDPEVIGVPFYLMERRRGLIIRHKLPEPLNDLGTRRKLSESVLDTLVALHNVDIHATGIDKIGKPAGFVTRQVRGWADRWQRSKTNELPEMDQVVEWLIARIPADAADGATIVHNDFKLDNLMLAEADPAHVVAVLDWEMCTVGDPLIDVGLLLSYWTMKGSDQVSSLRAVTIGDGWFTRDEMIERYENQTGRDLSRIAFYETFARFKVAVVIQQIYFRYVRGQTKDERFRNFDALVLELTIDALELAQRSWI